LHPEVEIAIISMQKWKRARPKETQKAEHMKGTIKAGSTAEDMHTHAASVAAGQKGSAVKCEPAECSQRGWIVNGCYWCGRDNCVNPGWLMAQCCNCGKWYFVSR
jgi:hypothetical protein